MTMKRTIAVVVTCGLVTLPAVPVLAKRLDTYQREERREQQEDRREEKASARDDAEEEQAHEAAQKARREAEGAPAPHADDLGGDEPDSLDTR
jgi:sRNA-binding protein